MPDDDSSAKSGPSKPSTRARTKPDDAGDAGGIDSEDTKESKPGMSVPDQQQLIAKLLRRYGTGRSR